VNKIKRKFIPVVIDINSNMILTQLGKRCPQKSFNYLEQRGDW